MPTKDFMTKSFAGSSLAHMQSRFIATNDLRVVAMEAYELKPLCTLEDYRAAYSTLAALLAALALHNTLAKGSLWELTASSEVQAACTEDELLAWAQPTDCAMAVLMGYELCWGYWDGRLKGLAQHSIVYPTMKHLGSLALSTPDMPLIRPAEQAAAVLQRRLREATALHVSRFGTEPCNLPLIENVLSALDRAQALVVLAPSR